MELIAVYVAGYVLAVRGAALFMAELARLDGVFPSPHHGVNLLSGVLLAVAVVTFALFWPVWLWFGGKVLMFGGKVRIYRSARKIWESKPPK